MSVKKAITLAVDKQKRSFFSQDAFIAPLLSKKIAHLTNGELRYLEIKIVLFGAAKFVLLDEPYNELSPLMIEVVNKMIKSDSENKGIIITDHNYENVIAISTRLILIKEGKVHNINNKQELIEKNYLTGSAFFINNS